MKVDKDTTQGFSCGTISRATVEMASKLLSVFLRVATKQEFTGFNYSIQSRLIQFQ